MHRRNGLSLIELLVVIAIVGALIALLFPAVQSAREAARRTTCLNQLKQIGIALHSYHEALRVFPPGYIYKRGTEGNHAGFGWGAMILPRLEQQALYDQFEWNAPLWGPQNERPRKTHLAAFLCPSDPNSEGEFVMMGDDEFAMGCYVGSFGPGDMDEFQEDRRGMFSRNSFTRTRDVRDGLSNTMMVGERINGPFRGTTAHGVHVTYETTWSGAVREITDFSDDHGHMVLFQAGHTPNHELSDDRDVSAPHPHGAHFLMADGSVRFVEETIDADLYQGMSTIAGFEPESKVD
jgi:prepilin-type N-terminal cleavage/methylation domain-containing protein/prepilin-type processing-associated H-X9-DG protein